MFLTIVLYVWLYSFQFSEFQLWFFKHFSNNISKFSKRLSTSRIRCLSIVCLFRRRKCLWNHSNNNVLFIAIMFSWFNEIFHRKDWKEKKQLSNRKTAFFFIKRVFSSNLNRYWLWKIIEMFRKTFLMFFFHDATIWSCCYGITSHNDAWQFCTSWYSLKRSEYYVKIAKASKNVNDYK